MAAIVSPVREPLIYGNKTYHDITEDICAPTEKAPHRQWVIGMIVSVSLLAFGIFSILWEIYFGIGSWNLNRTIGWGYDITNFVWWVNKVCCKSAVKSRIVLVAVAEPLSSVPVLRFW